MCGRLLLLAAGWCMPRTPSQYRKLREARRVEWKALAANLLELLGSLLRESLEQEDGTWSDEESEPEADGLRDPPSTTTGSDVAAAASG